MQLCSPWIWPNFVKDCNGNRFSTSRKKGNKAKPCRLSFVFFPILLSFSTSSFSSNSALYVNLCTLYDTKAWTDSILVIFEFCGFACIHEKYFALCVAKFSFTVHCTGTQSIICNTRRRRRFVRLVLPVVLVHCCLPVVSEMLSD